MLVIISGKNKIRKKRISMRLLVFCSIMIAGVIPMLIIMYSGLIISNKDLKKSRFNDVKANASMIINVINTSGYINNHEDNSTEDDIEALALMYSGRIFIVDDDLTILKDTYNKENNKTCISSDVIKCIKNNEEIVLNDKKNGYVELIMPIVNMDDIVSGAMIVGYSEEDIVQSLADINGKQLLFVVCIIVLIGLLAVFISSLISKSVDKVEKSVRKISQGYMDEQILVNDFKETRVLSESLNAMCASIQRLENSRQEFVSNVSHELKTPITSMKVLADSLIGQEEVPNELYKEFMTDIAAEIDRENKIITDLLAMVKMDKSADELNVESVNINELVEMLLKRLRPLAQQRNIEIILESFRTVVAEVDETKISLALSNIIENAIKYNYEDGWIRVSLNADHKYFYVRVSDSGVGIPKDCIDNIFERFYRVDKARSRETGGTGLGLSITRKVILMHKGAVKVHSKEKEGTTFTVRIPLNYVGK